MKRIQMETFAHFVASASNQEYLFASLPEFELLNSRPVRLVCDDRRFYMRSQ